MPARHKEYQAAAYCPQDNCSRSEGDGITKDLTESSSVQSDETGKALSQASLPFCALASNLALDTWSASRNIVSKFL